MSHFSDVQPAIDNLTNNQIQADMDGCMVTVSRQALDEVLSAIAALSAAPGEPCAIKPLEWRDHRPDSFPEPAWSAQTPFGFYNIEEVCASDSPAYVVRLHAHHFIADKDGLDEAKDAAQADYEQRIRSALATTPQPAAGWDELPAIPDEDADFTPDLARKIIAKYQQIISSLRREAPAPADGKGASVTEDQIKHMVDRFLGWTLPANFNPDGGVSFKRLENRYHHPDAPPFYPMPIGTNLFDAIQATEMVHYMIDGLSARPDTAEARDQIAALAHRFWSIHPREIQDMGLTREQFYVREIAALVDTAEERLREAVIAELLRASDNGVVAWNTVQELKPYIDKALSTGDEAKESEGGECACGKFNDGRTCPDADGRPLCVHPNAPGPSEAESNIKPVYITCAVCEKEARPDCEHSYCGFRGKPIEPIGYIALSAKESEGDVEGHVIPRMTSATTTRYPATEGERHMVAPARRTEEQSSTKTGPASIKPGPSEPSPPADRRGIVARDEDHPDCTTDRECELYDALMGLTSAVMVRRKEWRNWVQGGVLIEPIVTRALRLPLDGGR